MEAVLDQAQLGLAPDEGCLQAGGPVGASALRHDADGAPCRDRRFLALQDLGAGLLEEDRRAGRAARRLADEDRAGRGDRLEAAGGVHEVARDQALVRGADRDGGLAREDPGPQVQLQAGVAAQVADVGHQLQAGSHRAFGVVLLGDRRAPHGHHGVADELLHGSAVALDRLAAGLEVAGQQLADGLGVAAGGEGREADEVGEEDADEASLGGRGASARAQSVPTPACPPGPDSVGSPEAAPADEGAVAPPAAGLALEAPPAASGAPHSPQNFVPAVFWAPQAEQPAERRVPHSPQNLRPGSLEDPQLEQITRVPRSPSSMTGKRSRPGPRTTIPGSALRRRPRQAGRAIGPRPWRAMISTTRSPSRPCAVIPSAPVIDPATSMALTIASSTASTAPWKSGVIRESSSIRTSWTAAGAGTVAGPGSPRLPVANAMKMSPEPVDPIPPIRAIPRPARWASRSHWCGRSGASVARTTMIEPEPGARAGADPAGIPSGRRAAGSPAGRHAADPADDRLAGPGARLCVGRIPRARHVRGRDRLADRHAVDPQELPAPVVRLDQRADGEPASVGPDDPRRRPDPALELMADHPGPAAHGTLGHRAAGGRRQGGVQVLGPDVEAVDVVEDAVVRLPDDRQRPEVGVRPVGPHRVNQQRVVDDSHRVGVGDRDRAGQEAGLADPLEARQLAVAVEAVAAREDRLDEGVAVVRHHHGHAGPDRPLTDHPRSVAADQRRVPDAHARHVRDRVERARLQPPQDNPVVACAHAFLRQTPPSLQFLAAPRVAGRRR